MNVTTRAPAAISIASNIGDVFSIRCGQCDRSAAAITRRRALTKTESRRTARRRSPRRAVTAPPDEVAIARCGPLRDFCDAPDFPPDQPTHGKFFSQTKHFAADSSFFAPQNGQKI